MESNITSSSTAENCTVADGEFSEATLPMKISYTLVYPLIVFVGGFLHYGIAYYDHNAGDSQKRGLLNQLLSYMSLNTIVHLFIQTTSILIGVWIGPLNELVCTLSVVPQMICMYNLELVLLEQTLNRHIKIQRWKIKSKLEVKFWIRFYAIVNNCVAILLVSTELYLDELKYFLTYQVLSGQVSCITKIPLVFVWMLRIGASVTLLNLIILKCKPKKSNQIQPIIHAFGFNNLAENPKLLTDTQLILICLCLSFSALPAKQMAASAKTTDFRIILCLPFQITLGLIIPSLIYGFNEKLRDYIWDEFMPDSIKDVGTKINQWKNRQNNVEEFELQSVNSDEKSKEISAKIECVEPRSDEFELEEITKECQPSTSQDERCQCHLKLEKKRTKQCLPAVEFVEDSAVEQKSIVEVSKLQSVAKTSSTRPQAILPVIPERHHWLPAAPVDQPD